MKFLCTLLVILSWTSTFGQNLVPTINDQKVKVLYSNKPGAMAFQPQDVKLLDGPFKKAMELDAAYLLEIEPDRLLHRFRKFAGLQPKGDIYGGWEKETLSGHSLGHYLSACALQYASTQDNRFLDRVNYIVDELSECQTARKTGYVGAIPKEDSVWNLVSKGQMRVLDFSLNGAWSPWYTEHKILAGLIDAYWYADNKKALGITIHFCDWVGELLKNLSPEQIQKMLDCEFGGMNEALVNVYALTGDKKYLDLSYKFEHNKVIDPLSKQQDDLNDKHSNTQIPKIIGSARRYEFTSSPKDKTVGEFFWNTIVSNHTYAIGGNSDSEHLGAPGKMNERLSDNTAETCNTYNMLKLTRHLFTQQPKAAYADYYERALYNHIYASQRPTDGMMCYFTPLRKGGKKDYSDKFNSFWCCVGSGMENHVKYNESIYYRSDDGGLYVNLFTPSELTWKEKQVVLTQETQFPEASSSTIKIKSSKQASFSIYIRKPWWAKSDFVFTVNGQSISAKLNANGYYAISQKWNSGDVVKMEMPMQLYTEAMPDNANRMAFMYGPIVLAARMGQEEPKPITGTPVILTENRNIKDWTKKEPSSLLFKTSGVGSPRDITLVPFNTIHDERYNVYWDMFTPAEWEKEKQYYDDEARKASELEKLTVDFLQPGDSASEKAHSLTSAKSYRGRSNGKRWRDAREDGFISFTLKTESATAQTLILTYWGSDGGGRLFFDIVVDGETIATQEVRQNFPNRFFDIRYKLDERLTKDKKTISVLLKPHTDKRVARVFGVRVVKN
jgi:DUF1680 family protein